MTGYLPLDWCIFIEILKWTCTRQWRCYYLLRHEGQVLDNFKKFLSIKVIKIVLYSMLYETLKWPQIAPFWILSKKKTMQTPPPPLSRIMACTLLSISYAPGKRNTLFLIVSREYSYWMQTHMGNEGQSTILTASCLVTC